MKVPSRDYRLPLDYLCPSLDVGAGVWQDHLVRHPLGVDGTVVAGGPAPWNVEGWEHTDPPVITSGRRSKLVKKIGALQADDAVCEVPEFAGRTRKPVDPDAACKVCPPPLIEHCHRLLHDDDPVGPLYAALTDSLVAAAADGIVVDRLAFKNAVLRLAVRSSTALTTAVVLSFGVSHTRQPIAIARIARGDGTRTEFYVHVSTRVLRWRSTYRVSRSATSPARPAAGEAQFLFDLAPSSARFDRLSEACIVARPWWQEHGN